MSFPVILNQPRVNNTQTIEKQEKPKAEHKVDYREVFDFPKGITINNAASYNPNIEKLSPGVLFDVQYLNATELSDGSKLVRPICLSLGNVSIDPTENEKEYEVVFHNYTNRTDNGPIIKVMSEDELLANKTLCAGKLKGTNDPTLFELQYRDKNGEINEFIGDKKLCLNILEDNFLYM